jgi:hypothetical protein
MFPRADILGHHSSGSSSGDIDRLRLTITGRLVATMDNLCPNNDREKRRSAANDQIGSMHPHAPDAYRLIR